MANWESFRVVDIISEIDEEKYVLPVMQRELVWSMEKMELLFDSLLKSNSFGSIIVIEEDEDSPAIFASRPFTKDGTLLPSQNKKQLTQKQYFVIDGQQRLQSFYIGLKGSYKGKILFFDLFSDYSENFEFQFANEIQKLPNITKEERPLQKRLWYSCKDLFLKAKKDPDFDDVSSDIIKSLKIEDEEQKKHIRENIKAFYNNIILEKTIGIAIVKLNSKAFTASLANIFDNWETSTSDFKPMKIWICRSLLNGVFRSRGAGWIAYKTGIKKLLNEIKKHKGETFPHKELFDVYINHPIKYIEHINEDSLDSLDREFIFYFIYSGKPQVNRTNDVDHIMPCNILEKNGYSKDDIDSVKNLQLLDYKTNRGTKNGKSFLEWIGNEEYVKDKTTYMETHFIPKDESLWDEKHFLEFSKKTRRINCRVY